MFLKKIYHMIELIQPNMQTLLSSFVSPPHIRAKLGPELFTTLGTAIYIMQP